MSRVDGKQSNMFDNIFVGMPDQKRIHEAIFSPDRVYRYFLIDWDLGSGKGICLFIMCNPSTADEYQSDPTITRCKGYAKDWGYRSLTICNIFAYRSTDASVLSRVPDPIGPANNDHILAAAQWADRIILAWSEEGRLQGRGKAVGNMLTSLGMGWKMFVLKLNQSGEPSHPLYLRADLEPKPFWKPEQGVARI